MAGLNKKRSVTAVRSWTSVGSKSSDQGTLDEFGPGGLGLEKIN